MAEKPLAPNGRTAGGYAPQSDARKTELSLRSAIFMIASGVAMSVAGFVADPFGEISDSVLWFLAQSLLYAGSIFGVTVYIKTRFAEISGKQ